MEVKLEAIKQVFFNPENDYRVLSCIPLDDSPVELNKWGNFTLSGYNLIEIELYTPVTLDIELDVTAKYPASYAVLGYAGISFENGIHVDPAHERVLLEQIMEPSQAKYVNEAYPNFIEMILNDKIDEIDVDKIHNVGDKRLELYIQKIKSRMKIFAFFSMAKKYNITDFKTIQKFTNNYLSPLGWEKDYKEHPYKVLFDVSDWGFKKIDKLVLSSVPEMADSLERATYCIKNILEESELDGDTRLSGYILADIIAEDYPELKDKIREAMENPMFVYDPISKDCSLASTYNAEKLIAQNILNRVNNPYKDTMDWEKFKVVDGYTMTDEQIQLCRIANDESIGMLVGPGGTGKSTSTRALIEMLDAYGKTYKLLAPTGIAAKKLAESTRRPASTIHLALYRNDFDETYDYVIIDEMSCVGVHLLATVFSMIPEDTKIIFVCDAAQLASISCGNIVQDILDFNKLDAPYKIPVAFLTKVFRYGTSGIATIATNTRNGVDEGRNDKYEAGDYICEDIDSEDALKQIVEAYHNLLAEGYTKNDILILCPFNKSKIGTYMINDAIQSSCNPSNNSVSFDLKVKGCPLTKLTFKVGDRVINTKNNYRACIAERDEEGDWCEGKMTAIMNGDIGVIREFAFNEFTGAASFIVQFDERLVYFGQKDLKNLLLGYCISVHKSQGSQAKAIISVIGKNHKKMVTRNLLYVAVSRAQEKLIEIVDKDCISDGLEREETVERTTWLKDFLEGG